MVYTQKFVENKEAVRIVSAPFAVLQERVLTSKLPFFVPSGEYIVTMQAVPLEEPLVDDLYKVKYELFFEEN
ncbi:competence protein ComJ [Bacillus sp. FJAT-51639]|uniref:Competence protein ComJ n=2 Tax=Bacillus bruguierae TaxID=3127667 RepID=A0ABU8FKC4_9BACI